MPTDNRTTLAPEAPAIEAPRRRKRPRRRIPDGAKSGRLVSTRTLSGPDRAKLAEFRATLDREIVGWQDRLTADLGGDLSTAEESIVRLAGAKLRLALTMARWIEERPSRVANGTTGKVADVATAFLRASESVERSLSLIGMKRRPREVESLASILAGPVAPEQEAEVMDKKGADKDEVQALDPALGMVAEVEQGDLVAVPVEQEAVPEVRVLPPSKTMGSSVALD